MTTMMEGDLGNFKMRAPAEGDRLLLREWLRLDPSETGFSDPDFLLGLGPSALSNPTCTVVESGKTPVMFLRLSRAARIYLQVAPAMSAEERARNRQALGAVLSALEGPLSLTGTEQFILADAITSIQSFAAKELGFSVSTNTLIKSLHPAKLR